ncbi:MAG: 4-alpha-glucanotransferase [Rubrivivax sp.]
MTDSSNSPDTQNPLDRLAESHGIQLAYVSELGERRLIDDTTKRALLTALGVDPAGTDFGHFDEATDAPSQRCAMPQAILENRCWGIACQLYGLRSERNLGIGDFEDLATLTALAAQSGAAFVGLNPLHALFLADPGRFSPYSPSSRRFLNPLYIAIDQLDGGPQAIAALRAESPQLFEQLDSEWVDYLAVGQVKRQLLQRVFAASGRRVLSDPASQAFIDLGGAGLASFALFEALSEAQVEAGLWAGWHSWPAALQQHDGAEVARFRSAQTDRVDFHRWLQFEADRQLARVQVQARAAGMHIGLYLDLAVGVAPDGAETWMDPTLTVGDARVGSPPDLFNSQGQDWGLAPQSPKALAERGFSPLRDSFERLTRHAGAVRIDHSMGLARLWWIPSGLRSSGGGYIRYPLGEMVDTLAEVSQHNSCLVVGEDLGTVPAGFRHTMEQANVLSYRALYFERHGLTEFLPPSAYPQLSLACISTHDLPTLAGWWAGADIALREQTGIQNTAACARDREDRRRDQRSLMAALAEAELLPPEFMRVASGEDEAPLQLPTVLALAVHRFIARTPSVLVTVQLEDLIGSQQQPNLPGTTDQYPNWRIRMPMTVSDIGRSAHFQSLTAAMRQERPAASAPPETQRGPAGSGDSGGSA